MGDFGDLLGTLMVSLVRARQLADEATAVAAEQYRQHPLLEGMSIPRVRIPELTLDLPVLIKQEDEGEPAEPQAPETVAAEAAKALDAAAKTAGVKLPPALAKQFEADVGAELARQRPVGPTAAAGPRPRPSGFVRPLTREGVGRVAEKAVVRVLSGQTVEGLSPDVVSRIKGAVRARAAEVAEKKPGRLPGFGASINTAEVKDQAGAESVTRIRLTLREEGLEWTSVKAPDGSSKERLGPE